MFGERADYNQTITALKILNKAVALYWEAFVAWAIDRETDTDSHMCSLS